MSMPPTNERPRARGRLRIGSDDARAWVRKLDLGNPFAKAILMAVANYMNEDGVAWPGIVTLAQDTDIAEDTVVSRLRWCESIGAIAIFKCWVDEHGRRNSEGRGRVTSSEIRFLFDTDPEEIAANADSNTKPKQLRGAALAAHEAKAASPRPDGELTEEISTRPHREQNTVSTGLAPDSPPTPADRREELEPKKDSPPNPPPGGCDADLADLRAAYPIPITDVPKTQAAWSAMTEQERKEALLGARGYAAFIDKERKRGRSRNVKDAHRWLRDRGWIGYLDEGAKADQLALRFDAHEGSPEWLAWDVLFRICGRSSGIASAYARGETGSRIVNVPQQWPPVCGGADIPFDQWKSVFEGSGEFAAWLRRLRELPDIRIGLSSKPDETGKMKHCLVVPTPWPPRKSDDLAKTG